MRRFFLCAVLGLGAAACNTTGLTGQTYPDREQVSFRSADGVTVRSYACVPGANGAGAHRYVDGEILEAEMRFARENAGGLGGALGARAGVNQEIARITRVADADFRCAYLGSRDA